MIKKSMTPMAIVGIIATTSFAQGLVEQDVEKATRFRVVEPQAATNDAESTADTASEEKSPTPRADEENPFELSKGVDPLEVVGGSAQLEDLRLPRFCWVCRWICC